jgi:X-linked retinitis pigmentosa GTPase regulator
MSSFFTIPYIAFLGLILLLISGVYIFLVKRMANQNHQFCSIVGVVTSLADELNRLKEFISTTLIQKSNDSSKEIQLTKNDLIHVSDDEEEEDSDDDEEDTDEESDDDEEDTDEEDNKYELSNEIASNLEIDTSDEIKYIQITPTIKEEELIKISEKEEINLETITEEEQPITEESTTEEIKEISESDEVVDYKKLPLNKLRSLIVEKGLAEDASKLKKPVLLQMLEQIN